jgi:hypothetical protein
LLHVPVANVQVLKDLTKGVEIGSGFGRASDFRQAHNLDERHTAPVEIDETVLLTLSLGMLGFSSVLLEMKADEPYLTDPTLHRNGNPPPLKEGLLVLGDLVGLGKIRIKVVFPSEDTGLIDAGANCQTHAEGQLHGPPIRHRENTGMAKAKGTGLRVGGCAEIGGTPAEELSPGQELCVDFEPYDGFVFQNVPPTPI